MFPCGHAVMVFRCVCALTLSRSKTIVDLGNDLAFFLLVSLLKVGRVGFADSCSNLIGQPFYKVRCILEIVASVAGASAAASPAP